MKAISLKLVYIFFFFTFSIKNIYSNSYNDSLLNLYRNTSSEYLKFKYLKAYIQNHHNLNPDTLYKYANYCLQLSVKFKSDSSIGISNMIIGMSYQKKQDFNNAIKYYTIAEPYYKKVNYYEGFAANKYFRAVMYVFSGDLKMALKDLFEALEVCETHKLNDRAADILIGLANVYGRLENFNKCIEYNLKAIELIEKQSKINYYSLIASYINLGGMYAKTDKYEKAISILNKAINLATDKNYIDWKTKANGNLAATYLQFGNHKLALKHFLISVSLAETIDDKNSLSESYLNLGNLYSELNDKNNAERYFNKSLKIANDLNDIDALKGIYFLMYQSYFKFGDYKSSVIYLQKHMKLKDSLVNNINLAQLNDLEAKYNNEKKEQLNKLLQKENLLKESGLKLQKSITIFVVIGLFISLILLLFIFRGLKKQRNANNVISIQKKEVENQKIKIEEHQKEILDSIKYAKRIQEAHLPNINFLNKYLKNKT
ncbi:MAG: tetratricopeptide repeat protein [Bacteroidetes bacterium]|nr:tetratricopeptide repeat protein [Bacteroidota bacterium]